ncbi:hypothetical protein SDC9_203680 [bioreactor metagenome]|uniref:Uncharacterized protein n=1 Tax=bioreactor metagenome TaxID=1076179 RepID=A0A645IXU7_9ZZZZ
MLGDPDHASQPQADTEELGWCQPFAGDQGRQQQGEQRAGADQDRGECRRRSLHAPVGQAQVHRVVEHPCHQGAARQGHAAQAAALEGAHAGE